MIIVRNKIISQYTHIEIIFKYKNNSKKIGSLIKMVYKYLDTNIQSVLKTYDKQNFVSISEKRDLDFSDFFDNLFYNHNYNDFDYKKIRNIEKLINKLVNKIRDLQNEISENCYAIFFNNNLEIARTNTFESKEKLFDWLHDNEIVPSNSFKELEIKAGL